MKNNMNYEMVPVVTITDLKKEVETHFDPSVLSCNETNLAVILFGYNYNNNAYRYYNFKNDPIFTGALWQDKDAIRVISCVNAVLRKSFPDKSTVLINVNK